MADNRSDDLRALFARYITSRARVSDPHIVNAFAAVPREAFAGPGPWSISVPGVRYIETPSDDLAFLYQDTLVAIDAARGINIGEPSLHALCIDALGLVQGETVLHVGAGTGYYTAILATLVGPNGHIDAFEIEADLAERAAANLAHLPRVNVAARSGLSNLPTADAIYVNAGLPQPAPTWLDALRPGAGRLLFLFQTSKAHGGMLLVKRPSSGVSWPAKILTTASFIGFQGGQNNEASERLAAALASGGWEEVRSLRRDEPPDCTCWVEGNGWWLSTAPPER